MSQTKTEHHRDLLYKEDTELPRTSFSKESNETTGNPPPPQENFSAPLRFRLPPSLAKRPPSIPHTPVQIAGKERLARGLLPWSPHSPLAARRPQAGYADAVAAVPEPRLLHRRRPLGARRLAPRPAAAAQSDRSLPSRGEMHGTRSRRLPKNRAMVYILSEQLARIRRLLKNRSRAFDCQRRLAG